MNKQSLRALSLGFFFSALLVGGYQLMDRPQAAEQPAENAEETSNMIDSSLALEDSTKADSANSEENQAEETDSKESETDTSGDSEEETQEDETQNNSSEEDQQDEKDETPVVIIVKDGQPSSVVAGQLKEEGLIDNSFDFDQFLEKNNYATKIRPGSYEVKKGMDFEQIAGVLLNR